MLKLGSFKFLLILILLSTSQFETLSAECCPKKDFLSCWGKGACNIFCCNCDGGCLDSHNEKNKIVFQTDSKIINKYLLKITRAGFYIYFSYYIRIPFK